MIQVIPEPTSQNVQVREAVLLYDTVFAVRMTYRTAGPVFDIMVTTPGTWSRKNGIYALRDECLAEAAKCLRAAIASHLAIINPIDNH